MFIVVREAFEYAICLVQLRSLHFIQSETDLPSNQHTNDKITALEL